MSDNAARKSEKVQRMLFRRTVHRVWQLVKSGRRGELSDRDDQLADILLEHEQYGGHFEDTRILDGGAYEKGRTFNPFLHISTHQMVEDQLSTENPIEATLFCETMEDRGCSRHEAIHFIIMILLHVMYASASSKRSFDTARYKRLLKRCREVEPSEIDRVIEEDYSTKYRPDLH
ncbi:MAG: DUF1841 family protein [Thermodesulfobacteriota bacterium]